MKKLHRYFDNTSFVLGIPTAAGVAAFIIVFISPSGFLLSLQAGALIGMYAGLTVLIGMFFTGYLHSNLTSKSVKALLACITLSLLVALLIAGPAAAAEAARYGGDAFCAPVRNGLGGIQCAL